MNKMALVRIILFALSWVNQYLVAHNQQPLPILSEDVVAEALTFIISVWTLATHNHLKKQSKT